MCHPNKRNEPSIERAQSSATVPRDNDHVSAAETLPSKVVGGSWWRPGPVHPLVIVAMMPLCPTWFFLNRGFTQWFHWGIIFHLMTGRTDYTRRFLVLIGCGVCAGWYSAVVFEYFAYGRLCELLYNNMPHSMKAVMLTNGHLASGGIITDTAPALANLAATHIIDFLAHPYLAHVVWKMHTSRGGTLKSLLTWDVVVPAYIWTRVYSIVHMYYNNGYVDGLYYYGYDVYNIDNLESYTAAYLGEALFYVAAVVYMVYCKTGTGESLSPKQLSNLCVEDRQKPKLVQSESCFSTSSSSL